MFGLRILRSFGMGLIGRPRAKDFYQHLKLPNTIESFKSSAQELKQSVADVKNKRYGKFARGMNALGLPFNVLSSAVKLGVNFAGDILGMFGSPLASLAGLSTTGIPMLALMGTYYGGKYAAKATGKAWGLTQDVVEKATGWRPSIRKTAGKVASVGAQAVGHAGMEAVAGAGAAAVGVGKFLWQTRNNALVGAGLIGGAATLGALHGNKTSMINTTLNIGGSSFEKPAYMLNESSGFSRDDYTGTKPYSLPGQMDSMSATGDLVFALNNLRKGGYM